MRYYFLPAANKINVLAQASYDYSKWKETEGGLSGSAVGEQVRKGYTLAAGPACMLARHVSLEVLAKYNYYKYLEVKDSFIILAAGFQIHLGKGSTGK